MTTRPARHRAHDDRTEPDRRRDALDGVGAGNPDPGPGDAPPSGSQRVLRDDREVRPGYEDQHHGGQKRRVRLPRHVNPGYRPGRAGIDSRVSGRPLEGPEAMAYPARGEQAPAEVRI